MTVLGYIFCLFVGYAFARAEIFEGDIPPGRSKK